MRKQLLMAAALGAACFAFSAAHAAPAAGVLPLKTSAGEGSAIQQVHYYRHHHRYRHARADCWWKDRWLCRWFW